MQKHSLPTLTFTLMLAIFACALPVCAAQPALSEGAIAEIGLPNYQRPESTILVSGQPDKAQFKALSEAGIKHIITLRPASELDWNEEALVTALGMQFHAIPVNGASGVTTDNARELLSLLETLKGQPILLHCASGNRVGALAALSYHQQGHSTDESLAEGKRWGLTRLQSLVREKLDEQPLLCCADDTATPGDGR